MKTTYLIELKLTGFIGWVNDGLYTNFQGILNFHKILEYFLLGYIGTFYGLVSIQIY